MKKLAFEQEIKKHEERLLKQNLTYKRVGYIKLAHVAFVAFFIYLIFNYNDNPIPFIVSSIVIFLLIGFWIFHGKLKEEINYSKGMIQINQRHLDRITGAWSGFSDIGSEFVNHDHAYASDLDIVGRKSIFQFLNTTNTWHGRQQFANDLLAPSYTAEEIQKRQEAILELSEAIPFSNHVQYQFSQIGVHVTAKFIPKWLADKTTFMKSKALKTLAIYAPLITLLFAGFTFLTSITFLYFPVLVLFACQLLIWGASFFKTSNYLADIAHLSYNLDAYTQVIKSLQAQSFNSEKLKQIQEVLSDSENAAILAIKELARLANRANMRRNGIAFVILNMTLLFDITTAIGFCAWKQKYANYAEAWFVNLGEFESLLSFSNLPNVMPTTCLPKIVAGKTIEAKEIGHPLITNDKRVSNDVMLKDHIFIISGSNMSGKTTFMRTIGVNLILARCGSFVCAKDMHVSLLSVITSMRIADNLSEGISTFYAELRRVKRMIEMAKEAPDTLFLIDEIFRGTNSVDRLVGAKTILEKLDELRVVGIITTHDLELCDIAKTKSRIKNYSFSESYSENEIHFDYLMKAGKSTTTNAKYLMRMMDII